MVVVKVENTVNKPRGNGLQAGVWLTGPATLRQRCVRIEFREETVRISLELWATIW